MGGFVSLSTAVSGLNAAQAGLYITGHNMANSGMQGFSRQRAVQNDFMYTTIGNSRQGAMKIGLGTNVEQIQQIRDKYLDMSYRQEAGKLGYYSVKAGTGDFIESVLGELQSHYNAQSVIQNLWDSLQELSEYPEGQETRADFIENSIVFVDKMTNVYDRLFQYQHNLDGQIREMVSTINDLVEKISKLNTQIMRAQASGDNPNDLRDERNNYLDDLSLYLDIDYTEAKGGRVDIFVEGKELLMDNFQVKLGLQYISGDYSFVQPVFGAPYDGSIIPADKLPPPQTLYNSKTAVSATQGNDKGQLKGLFYTRGLYPANYTDSNLSPSDGERYYNMKNFFIPSLMAEMDLIFNKIVTMVNDAMAPTGLSDPNDPTSVDPADWPYNNYKIKGDPTEEDLWAPAEIFKRKFMDRWDGDATSGYTFNPADPSDYNSLYTLGNIVVNPALSQEGGYNLIAVSKTGDIGNYDIVLDILADWNDPKKGVAFGGGETLKIDSAYGRFVTRNGAATREALNFVNEQSVLLNKLDNDRAAISGVSLDEEMKNMMTFQHAYNASARVINAIDGMIDKLVNGTGRAGR